TDNPPRLKLLKDVQNNDGGTAVSHDYTLSAAAAKIGRASCRDRVEVSGTFDTVFAGATYTLSESPNPGTGYSSTGIWSCTAGTCTSPHKISERDGSAVTCTTDHTDNPPRLKLLKDVQNNDGGTAVSHDYTLSAAAATPDNGRNFSDFGDSSTFHNVFAGATYTLSESPNPGTGYSSTGIWSCTTGTFTSPNQIVVPLGTDVTCTIVNTDNTPTLKLVKDVINDNGGTKTAAD